MARLPARHPSRASVQHRKQPRVQPRSYLIRQSVALPSPKLAPGAMPDKQHAGADGICIFQSWSHYSNVNVPI